MDRKAQSKPMKEIISRLVSFGDFEVVNFGDEVRVSESRKGDRTKLEEVCMLAVCAGTGEAHHFYQICQE
jgi:hypothetical protein